MLTVKLSISLKNYPIVIKINTFPSEHYYRHRYFMGENWRILAFKIIWDLPPRSSLKMINPHPYCNNLLSKI